MQNQENIIMVVMISDHVEGAIESFRWQVNLVVSTSQITIFADSQ